MILTINYNIYWSLISELKAMLCGLPGLYDITIGSVLQRRLRKGCKAINWWAKASNLALLSPEPICWMQQATSSSAEIKSPKTEFRSSWILLGSLPKTATWGWICCQEYYSLRYTKTVIINCSPSSVPFFFHSLRWHAIWIRHFFVLFFYLLEFSLAFLFVSYYFIFY